METASTNRIRRSLILTHEEIAFLLWFLHIPALVGMGKNLLDGNNNERGSIILAAAERGLKTRGLLVTNQNAPATLDPDLQELIRVCAAPDLSIQIVRMLPGRPDQCFVFHMSPHLFIEHAMEEFGLHRFTLYPTQESWTCRARCLLTMNSHTATVAPLMLKIPKPLFDQSLKTAANLRSRPTPDAIQTVQNSLSPTGVQDTIGFANCLIRSASICSVMVVRPDSDGRRVATDRFDVYEGTVEPGALWLGRIHGTDIDVQISLQAIGSVELDQVFSDLFRRRSESPYSPI
jgi:hypothetical protein